MQQNKTRLSGIDLFRGIAAYAVVVLHSRPDPSLASGYWGAKLLILANFAVPFFLAISFYLAIAKAYSQQKFTSLKTRFLRLFIPYIFWSCLYLFIRIGKYLISGQIERISGLFSDPVGLMFCGGAAVQLYFLPLLFTGTCLLKPAEFLIQKGIKLKWLLLIFTGSILLYELILTTQNGFQIGGNIAFKNLLDEFFPTGNINPLVRIPTIILAWMIRCLPYILLAMILHHPSFNSLISRFNSKHITNIYGFLLVVILIGTQFLPFLPGAFREITIAYTSLLLAIYLSKNLPEKPIITELGLCSFGIYLMHHLTLEFLFILGAKIYPPLQTAVSITTLLIYSIPGFFLTWLAISKLKQNRYFTSLM
ncbi:MAG TPA: acyltransferase [Nostocaceae cyanobacterium]|nr:acyltransferase [Nostocaceae cyanobacterium]